MDMKIETFPFDDETAGCLPNEPQELMNAGVHSTWDTVEAEDRAFFRALGYRVRVPSR